MEETLHKILDATQLERIKWSLTIFERNQHSNQGVIPAEMTYAASFRLVTEKAGAFTRQSSDKILITKSVEGKYYFSIRADGMIVSYIADDDISDKKLLKKIYLAASKRTDRAVWDDLSEFIKTLD